MIGAGRRLEVSVRPYRDGDEPEVLALLATALGTGPAADPSPEFFRWKHVANPFGRSLALVAEADGRIVGLRAFMRWAFRLGERDIPALRAVDTATHPRYQGRGVFSRLTREAVAEAQGQADLIFNTPNQKSLPGYLKLGWGTVGRVPVAVQPRRPIRFLIHVRSWRRDVGDIGPAPDVIAESAREALAEQEALEILLGAAERSPDRLSTPRDPAYLRWRYGDAPLLDYRAVRLQEGARLRGLALFRVRPRGRLWEATVAELIVAEGDRGAARHLLGKIAATGVDHLTCSFPAGTTAALQARRSGFIGAPGGMNLVARPLRPALGLDLQDAGLWGLSLGDLEVF